MPDPSPESTIAAALADCRRLAVEAASARVRAEALELDLGAAQVQLAKAADVTRNLRGQLAGAESRIADLTDQVNALQSALEPACSATT